MKIQLKIISRKQHVPKYNIRTICAVYIELRNKVICYRVEDYYKSSINHILCYPQTKLGRFVLLWDISIYVLYDFTVLTEKSANKNSLVGAPNKRPTNFK